ncbi:MAG: glutamate 5-kinase [Patescibacteria group bacterium]|jgi:glutamate 5-kinase
MEKIIVKIGSQLITKGDGNLNAGIISGLVSDVSRVIQAGKRIVIVSSGAVASGRTARELKGDFSVSWGNQPKAIVREQILAAVGQPELMAVYKAEFKKHGLACAQILVTRSDFADRKKYLSLRTVTENLVNLGIVPIFNENDVLSSEELAFSDNDQLSAMVAAMLIAEKLIILTSVAGVYDKNPKDPEAMLLDEVTDIKKLLKTVDNTKSEVGRGGIKSKLLTAEQAGALGIEMIVACGSEPDILSRLVIGAEKIGTRFKASAKKAKPLKSWLAVAAHPKGKIVTSCYLSDILKTKQFSSILLSGVEEAEGNFKKGDVIAVCDVDGTILGKGQCRYGKDELIREIKDYKNIHTEGEKIEGGRKIVIHYDYFSFE